MMPKRLLLLPLLFAQPVMAQQSALPDPAAVTAALEAHPVVQAADARLEAARAEARALSAGPHEVVLSGTYARRDVRDPGLDPARYNEYEGQITRAVRLPGKAGLDRKIGAEGITYADNMAGDARHQTALRLAQFWWNWLDAAAQAGVDRQAAANAESLLATVKRRMSLRDASALEGDQAEAALAVARAAAARSAGAETVAKARLAAQFPGLTLPSAPPEVPMPDATPALLKRLHDHILGRSHEILAAEAMARQASASADRARADRMADPSLGLRVFSDKGGIERGAGVVLSIPLGGAYRAAQAGKASAAASAAQADLQSVRRDIQEVAESDLAEANATQTAWARARAALESQMAALGKVRRGHQLGEINLSDVLLAERLAHDAFRAEATARADAARAFTRLRIDAHDLWIDDESDRQQP